MTILMKLLSNIFLSVGAAYSRWFWALYFQKLAFFGKPLGADPKSFSFPIINGLSSIYPQARRLRSYPVPS